MIRFIDLRTADIGGNFAFFDTCYDCFLEISFCQVWVNTEDFLADLKIWGIPEKHPQNHERYLALLPDWAANPYDL